MSHPSVTITPAIDDLPVIVKHQKETWRLTQAEALAFADSLRNAVQQYVQRGRDYDRELPPKPAAAPSGPTKTTQKQVNVSSRPS
jgi:hypothetical protein